ncbi:MAG: hypothetical protein HDT20_02005 [Oscillibacter sp.]|nr:hypothetical protein [Oscillibacter sp.]
MRITIDRNGDVVHTTIEPVPLPPERFEAVCKLAWATVGGAVLLGAVHMVGVWAIGGALGALLLRGLYETLM